MPTLAETCAEIGTCYQSYRRTQRSRIMIENRMLAEVAVDQGYRSGLEAADREALFEQARAVIAEVRSDEKCHPEVADLILSTHLAIDQFLAREHRSTLLLKRIAKKLPVAAWATSPEQRGFGLFSLAKIVGETGDLTAKPGTPEEGGNYANPGKLWARMGCAPHEFRGRTLMGKTWRGQKPPLPASEWEEYGYCGRRRSVMHVIAEGILKANDGPYRQKYLAAKVSAFAKHPDWNWTDCTKCAGSGKVEGDDCNTCGGTGKKCGHAHNHAMLLMTKLLLKNLWKQWNPSAVVAEELLPWNQKASPVKPPRKKRKPELLAG